MSFIDQTKKAGEGAIVPGVHPRVFLDSSRLQFIRYKVAQNDPTWIRFENYLNMNGVPYSPNGYNLFLGALAYQALKVTDHVRANGYADTVINGMMAVINEGVSSAEDVNRYYLYNMGLAYDWVYGRLTPQQKTSIINWIDAVYQNNPNGHEKDSKTYGLHYLHNYTIDFMFGNAVAGYAIYDENQMLALDMIDNAAHRWSVDLVAQIAFIASNGAYPEGDGYGYHSIPNFFRYAKAVETAEGRNIWDDAQWIKNRMTYDMFAFFPTRYLDSERNGYYRDRVGSGDSSRHNFKGDLVRAGALIYISSHPDAEESKRMQSWLDAIYDKALGEETSVDDFLWYDSSQKKVSYSSAPLTTFSGQGTNNIALGEVIMRSDWTDSATWIRFVSGDYFLYHQHLEANHFNIFKYEDLATESGAYEGAGGSDHFGNYLKRTIAHNSVLVYAPGKDNEWFHGPSGWEYPGANDGGQRGIDIVDADGTILESLSWSITGYNHGEYPVVGNERFYDRADIRKYEDTGQYTYVLGSAAKAYSGWRCDLFDREFAFLRPAVSGGNDYIVIYDRVNAGDPAYLKYWMMHSLTLPEVSGTETPVETGISDFDGDTVMITNGNGRLFLKNLLPPGRKITRIGGLAEGKDSWVFGKNYPSDNWMPYGTYRIQIQPALQQNYDAFLNVLYPASSTTASMPLTTRIEAATNNMVGTLISDPSMNYVAMFSTDPAGASVTGPVTYVLNPTANVRHFLFNMVPNTAYDVAITSEGRNITVTPGSGKYLSSGQGVLTFDNSCILSVTKAGTGSGLVTSIPAGIDCGSSCVKTCEWGEEVTLRATPNSGSTLVEWWGGGCSGTGLCVVTMNASKTVTAIFQLQPTEQYSLTVNKTGTGIGTVTSDPSGINCGEDCNEVYDQGTNVTLTAVPAAGSTFTGWSGACSGTGSCNFTMDADKNVTAAFATAAPTQYTLTVSKTGSGSGTVTSSPTGIDCGSDCTETYDQGTSVTLTATPASGSSFAGWNADADCSDGVVTMNANMTCTATFNPQVVGYTLTVSKSGTGNGTVTSSPAGINCGSDCSETYTKVQKVKLTAKADTDSTFTGWSGGGCTGTKTCPVTVGAAVTVTASFALKTPDISIAQTTLDFGSIKVGKKATKTLKVTNNGTGDLVITLSGLEGTDFSIQGSSSVTIKAKKSYSLKVLFTPKSAGLETATLEVNSNDLDSPSIDISLSGTGQ